MDLAWPEKHTQKTFMVRRLSEDTTAGHFYIVDIQTNCWLENHYRKIALNMKRKRLTYCS